MKKAYLSKLIFTNCFVLLFSSCILADNTKPLSLEELMNLEITTANKVPVAVKDIPASVTVMTRAEIERYGYFTLADIIQNIPGMYLLDNTERLWISTRGVNGGGIEFLVNGISQHPSLQKTITSTDINKFNIPVESIDRIEVIRGPMSVMYGNNAFQGVINIITNDVASQGSMASVSIGTDGVSRQFARYATENKKYSIAINAGRYTTDGLSGDYVDMLSAAQLSILHPASDEKIDGKVPKEEKSLDLSATYGDLELNIRHNIMHYGIYASMPGIGDANYLDLETTHASLSYSIALNDYWTWKTSGINSQEEYTVPEFNFLLPEFDGNQHQTSKRQEFESILTYTNKEFNTIFGYQYRYIDDVENDLSAFLSDVMLQGAFYKLVPYKTHDLYTEINYKIASDWKISGGVRYSRLPSEFEQISYDKIDDSVSYFSVDTDSSDKLSWRLALAYHLNEQHSLHFIAGNAVQYRSNIEISDPEQIDSYELQHIVSYPDWQLQTSLFYNSISNIAQREIQFNTDGTTYSSLTNNVEWKTAGVELISSMQFDKQWKGSASLVYQNSQDTKYNVPIGYSPNLTFKIKTDYSDGPLIYSLNMNYIDELQAGYMIKQEGGVSTIERIGKTVDDYFLMGGHIRYVPNPNLYIDLKADNLFDETYHYPTNELASMEYGLIGMARVLMLTVGYKF